MESKLYKQWREVYHAADFLLDRFDKAEEEDFETKLFRDYLNKLKLSTIKLESMLEKQDGE